MNQDESSPNILWICTDQQRYDTISALGYPHLSTPNLDQLAAEGAAFERAYCQAPICTPSRASFLTGMYPSSIHVNRNGNPTFSDFPPLISKRLADAGYTCGLIGKLHLTSAYGRVEARTADGYSYWQYSHAPRDDWERGHDYADWLRSKGAELSELTKDPAGVPAELHQTTWCAEKTIEFIEANRDHPWFASVNIYDPHPPFNPPQAYRDKFDPRAVKPPLFRESDLAQQAKLAAIDFQSEARQPADLDIKSPILPQSPARAYIEPQTAGERDARTLIAAYYAMISLIDDQVGRILEGLEANGQRENTIIIFTSDHGETLGDHGLIQKGCRFYEGLVRVPLIWSWRGRFVNGLRSSALVELTDIAPTLLDICGLEAPDYMVGKSLRPILSGEAAPDAHRDVVRCEFIDALDMPDASVATMHFDGRYKLIVYHNHHLGELYDLEADPGEFDDLWESPAHQSLKAELLLRSFDTTMLTFYRGPDRIGPM
ncbi:MAG: sulfatase-like hydrolase/transferase [Chloroflexota bacterium]|nr:sulfatase-like hydrolase/transferase [Chloroflexota bacterium]MDE2948199.1 sulfatase-like hydrolase/transferase [Chloroflexota bacterium]